MSQTNHFAPLGIVAGGGVLPGRLVAACGVRGRPCFVIALTGQTDPGVVEGVPHAWIRLGEIGTGIDILRKAGVSDLVFAGPIRRPGLREVALDQWTARLATRVGLRAMGDDGLLRSLFAAVEGEGFRIVGVQSILDDLLAPRGTWGRMAPDEQARRDIARGIRVAAGLGALDVGQAVVVQQGIVLAVEAAEGTDAMLRRCSDLRRAGLGGVLVKIAKPGQDPRADLPTVGVETLRACLAAGLRGIAVEAAATIVIDPEAVISVADDIGLFVSGVSTASSEHDVGQDVGCP